MGGLPGLQITQYFGYHSSARPDGAATQPAHPGRRAAMARLQDSTGALDGVARLAEEGAEWRPGREYDIEETIGGQG